MHAYLPRFCEISSHPAIVSRIVSVLGRDVIAWGVGISTVRPGQRHRWHVDVEHQRWLGVTIFLGLKNISQKSSMKVISGSHRIAPSPQMIGVDDDVDALATSRRLDPRCELVTVEIKEGNSLSSMDGCGTARTTRAGSGVGRLLPSTRARMRHLRFPQTL